MARHRGWGSRCVIIFKLVSIMSQIKGCEERKTLCAVKTKVVCLHKWRHKYCIFVCELCMMFVVW